MKTNKIEVGKTYVNKGKGTTERTVIAIGPEHLPKIAWNADGKFPEGSVGVLYEQKGQRKPHCLWLTSFASWAGKEKP